MSMIADFFRLAVKNITHRQRRSWLTIIGILIGTASVVALVSLGQGLDQSITGEFEAIGADKIFINPGGDLAGGSASGFAEAAASLGDDDLSAIRRSRGVAEATGIFYKSARVEYKDDSRFLLVAGVPTDETYGLVAESFSMDVENGREVRSTDRSNVLIGSRVAQNMFEDPVPVRAKLAFSGEEFRVIGTLDSVGDPGTDESLFLPIDAARDVFDVDEVTYDYIIVRVQNGFDPEAVKAAIERTLRSERNLQEGEEDFTVSTPTDILDSFRNILGLVQWVVVGIASISLFVGGVGIMNTMYTSVTERTREIGVMKAVGARNTHVMAIFLIESGMIGLVGGVIGILLGLGLSYTAAIAATQYAGFDIMIAASPNLIVGTLLFSFVVGTVSGVLPARNAAKLKPADALRYE